MSPAALRMLDANLNRAREALRLLEDYARFALDEPDLCHAFKQLRHDLAEATAGIAGRAILHRDTPGDVGTDLSTPSERRRESLGATIIAAGKRFGEAARVLEELLKIEHPAGAGRIEQLRYRFYELERRINLVLRPANRFLGVRIYVLITQSACRLDWFTTAEAALAGGAEALQLREPGLAASELLLRARKLCGLCRDAGALFLVNDRPDVAILSGADGVHVGQNDMPAADVRRLIGPDLLVGVSTHTLEQVRQARLDGADYVGVGPVFPSLTKPRPEMAGLPGLEFAQAAADLGVLPTVAIAGITPSNAAEVWGAGVQAIAVTSAVTQSPDPAAAVRTLAELEKSR